MHSFSSGAPRRHRQAGFSLVEIMIVVVIIGLIAMMAYPAFVKIRRSAQSSRFVSDLRTFSQAFESYSMETGLWPAATGSGVVPNGMAGSFPRDAWIAVNSIGGRWTWDINANGVVACITVTGATAEDPQMMLIDQRVDDGNLNTGLFRKVGAGFIYILQE